jgi:hypothetical protein
VSHVKTDLYVELLDDETTTLYDIYGYSLKDEMLTVTQGGVVTIFPFARIRRIDVYTRVE